MKKSIKIPAPVRDNKAHKSEPWAKPYNLISVPTPQPIPPDAFPSRLSEYAVCTSGHFGNDPSLALLSALTVAAVVIHDDIHLILEEEGLWEEYPVLWTCGVGGTATAKTPVEEAALAPLLPLHTDLVHEERRSWELSNKGKKPADCKPPRPRNTGLKTTTATIEALGEIREHQEHGLLLFHPEFISIASRLTSSRDPASDERRGDYLAAWDCKERTIHRKIAGQTEIKSWAFSMLTACTPDLVDKMTRVADGFLQRFLIVLVPRQGRPKMQSPADLRRVQRRYKRLIEKLYELPQTRAFRLSSDARVTFYEWREAWREESRLNESEYPGYAGHLGKFEKMAARIALVLHLCQHAFTKGRLPSRVSGDTMTDACAILYAMKSHLTILYRSVGGSNGLLNSFAQYLLSRSYTSKEKSSGPLTMPVYKLSQEVFSSRAYSPRERQEALETLCEMSWIQAAKFIGQKITRIAVNPRLLQEFPEEAERAATEREARGVLANQNFAQRRKEKQ